MQPDINKDENFIGEFETMDLSELKDKFFMVAVNTGSREKAQYLCTTLHGPYSYVEMLEEVGFMWKEHQHHAKVYVVEKDRTKPNMWLDTNTIDYIEAQWENLIMDGLLDGTMEQKPFTCRAGMLVAGKDDEDEVKHE
jgi:hypothetical protein